VLLGEGTPKEMIDIYKQVLVGQYPLPSSDVKNLLDDDDIREAAAKADDKAKAKIKQEEKKTDKKAQGANPDTLEYGDGAATIDEFYVTDEKGVRSSSIIKGTDFTVHMRVKFNRDVAAPIFAFTFKNIMGIEITGTNSMVEKAFLEPVKAGDVKNISFTQNMSLQGGEYLISFGVTGFEQNNFTVYHRLYDALNITVVSDKNTVGYYDMNSTCKVED
jgi:teichoic acid transport system ATP-binding protein